MKILAVNLSLSAQLKTLGHEVLELRPPPGIYSISTDPQVAAFNPDMLIQQETLGSRILLAGIENLNCPKIFWSIDTHLNFFWHRLYGRNFDLVFTTQQSWTKHFISHGCSRSHWLPWFGKKRPWTPWSIRSHDISFVGRITEHRRVRGWMAEFLKNNYQATITEGLSFSEMLALYSSTRLVPNESISGEINFRIFEAASCGALVLSQSLMEELSTLYVPDQDVILFEHVLELKEKIDYYLGSPEKAKKVAFSGWNATQNRHLPEHRALEMQSHLLNATSIGTGHAFRTNLFLAIFELWECGRLPLQKEAIQKMMFSVPLDEEVLCAIIRLHSLEPEKILDLIIPILHQKQYDHDLMVNLNCSTAALKAERFDLALQFWKRCLLSQGRPPMVPDSPLQLYLFWSKELTRQGRRFRHGFMFDHNIHLPQSGLECLVSASRIEPQNKEILLNMKRLVQGQYGLESMVLSIVSLESLKERHNWRWNLELALYHLRCFRLREGLEELLLGEENARKSGEYELFINLLSARNADLGRYLGNPD